MSLKDRLSQAKPRTKQHQLRVEDDAAAREELAQAQASGDTDRIEAAQATLEGCYEPVTLVAMSPADWEELLSAHPPRDTDKQRGAWCEPVTFLPAALAACVRDEEITEADWADWTTKGALTPGEVGALLDAVVELHSRAPEPNIPKDSTRIRSS